VATWLDAGPILPGEEERKMANFLEYNPEQAYLLAATVRTVLGEDHPCFFVHGAVEKLDLRELEASYSDDLKVGHYNCRKKHAATSGSATKTAGLNPSTT
jgi:hypothetical protein